MSCIYSKIHIQSNNLIDKNTCIIIQLNHVTDIHNLVNPSNQMNAIFFSHI